MHCPSVADRRQRGSVTAEFALALPAVVLLLVFCLALLSGGTAQLRAADAARAELFKVFAEMPEAVPPEGYQAARLILKSHEARLLLSADPALRRAA